MISVFICSYLMRIKGGGPDITPKWFKDLDGSYVSAVLFGILCAFFFPWWQAVLCAVGWLIGNAPSIGEEIGAIGGIKGNWYSDRDSWFGSKIFKWVKSNTLWGWLSGSLRGAFLGMCLALPTLNPWFILCGASFPLVYFLGVSIEQLIKKKTTVSWHWSEWIYGAIIGIALVI